MKIKRYVEKDISSVIRKVRQELGPDAVILSNRELANGIEIVAAIDYDEALFDDLAINSHGPAASERPGSNGTPAARVRDKSTAPPEPPPAAPAEKRTINIEWSQEPTLVEMRRELESLRGLVQDQLTGFAWGDVARKQPQRLNLLRQLLDMGLSAKLCRDIADATPMTDDRDYMWRRALGLLAHRLPLVGEEIIEQGGVIALIGPTGVGKTTSIAKLATRFALKHGRQHLALVTTDSYRVGAHEQLRIYGRILDVPVRVANDGNELQEILTSLQDKRLVLIDTAGMSQRDVRLCEQFAMIRSGSPAIRNFLVLSATTQRAAIEEAVKNFGAADLQGCILTKTDEAASIGGALSAIIDNNLPLAYVSDGQRVPEDIHIARAHNLVIRATELKRSSEHMLEQELLGMVAERNV